MDNPCQNVPLTIIQGATFILQINYVGSTGNAINLTGYSADMQFRATVEDTGTPIIEVSTAGGGIVITYLAGIIVITISAAVTALLVNEQQMVYNLFITDSYGVVTPLMAGSAVVQGSTIR